MKRENGSGAIGRLKASRRRSYQGGGVGAASLGSLQEGTWRKKDQLEAIRKRDGCVHTWLMGEVASVCSSCQLTVGHGSEKPVQGWGIGGWE